MEFGGMVAAEMLGIPHAKVLINAAGARPRVTTMLYDPVQRLRATFGLHERSIQELMDQYLVLVPFPPSLNTVGDPIAPTAHYLRALPTDDRDVLPSWVNTVGSRPLIYVSLGTSSSGVQGEELFPKLLAGLRDIDAEFVLTVGRDLDPAVLGAQPKHVHIEKYLPLGALLPRCSAVVFHGGSGTLGLVVVHGLPMVILPFTADQPENATRCGELGASRTLDQDRLTPDHIREVVVDVLQTPSYRQCAERLRDEFNALPGPEFAVELLERLARDKSPIIAAR
jgi:MGT family glycosyltransferase